MKSAKANLKPVVHYLSYLFMAAAKAFRKIGGNALTYFFGINASVLSVCFIAPFMAGYTAPLPVAAAGIVCIFLARLADDLPDRLDNAAKWLMRQYRAMRKPLAGHTPGAERLRAQKGGIAGSSALGNLKAS